MQRSQFGSSIKIPENHLGAYVLLNGELHFGSVFEIHGDANVGKTTLALQICAMLQRFGANIAYIDVDYGLKRPSVERCGIIPGRFCIAHRSEATEVFNLALRLVRAFDVVVIDSIASLFTKEEEADITYSSPGRHAQRLGMITSVFSKTLAHTAFSSDTLVIVINQLRYDPEAHAHRPTGGRSLQRVVHTSLSLDWFSPTTLYPIRWSYDANKFYARTQGVLPVNTENRSYLFEGIFPCVS